MEIDKRQQQQLGDERAKKNAQGTSGTVRRSQLALTAVTGALLKSKCACGAFPCVS